MTEDFRKFAVETARQIATEEANKFKTVIQNDVDRIASEWAQQLAANIQNRMGELGIPQILSVTLEWNPGMPIVTLDGHTYIGGSDGEE